MSGNIGLPSSERGTWQFTVNYDWNSLETLKAGSERLDDDTRRRETHSVLLESGYSITDRLSVDAFFSFVRQERTISQQGLAEDFTSTQGVGDAVILLKYKTKPGLVVGGGLKLPLGSANRTRDGGLPLNADLQPGSGALDYILYANFQREFTARPTLVFSSTAIHRFTGTNNEYLGSSSYSFGNETQAIVGLADRLLIGRTFLDPSVRLRFRKAGRDRFDGADFPASGGNFLFINPGLSLAMSSSISFQTNIELPIYAEVYDTQLSPTIRINTGFHFSFTRKPPIEVIQLN